MTSVTVRVPAKVNLQLAVGSLRPDGFHELATVFQAVGLCDEVVARASDAPGIRLTISGEGEGRLPLDAGNLAYRAAALLGGARRHRAVGRPAHPQGDPGRRAAWPAAARTPPGRCSRATRCGVRPPRATS